MCSSRCLMKYDPSLPTVLSADSPLHRLEGALLQVQCSSGGVHFLTAMETHYAQGGEEASALACAAERFPDDLRGLNGGFPDRLPTSASRGGPPLDTLPPRIQRHRMQLMRLSYSTQFFPGKTIATADALSRAPVDELPRLGTLDVAGIETFAHSSLMYLDSIPLEKVKQAQRQGWPDMPCLQRLAAPYWQQS